MNDPSAGVAIEDRAKVDRQKSVAISDPIQNAMGQFGKWHLVVCAAVFLLKFPAAWHQMSIIFLAPPVSFECVNATFPKCSSECASHIFDRSVFPETIITEWDLVCDHSQWPNASQTLFMLGILIGSIGFGTWADNSGRRSPLVTAVFVQLAAGVATAFVPYFWMFCVLRFITALATGGTLVTSFVLIMELVGEKHRELVNMLYHVPFNLGYVTLPMFAYFYREWRHLQFALSILSILLISYYWLVPESPRWLFTIGRVDDAATILEKAAKQNKLPIESIRENLNMLAKKRQASAVSISRGTIVDLVRTPNMRMKTFCICFNWFACGLSYFGVAQYVGQSAGNIFVNVAISGLMTLPGNIIPIYTMKVYGRKKTLAGASALAGVCMLLVAVFPQFQVYLASSALIGLGMAFPTTYLYGGELFPTVVRNIGIGTCSMLARVGSMVAPFVIALTAVQPSLPPIILGIVPLISAFLLVFLPETRGQPLPATIEDGELFGKKGGVKVGQNYD